MSLYSRARKHIDMNRVKQLREKEITQEKIADTIKQQEELLVELKKIGIKEDPKYSNWRRELKEGMTSAAMFSVSLPAEGDTDLVDYGFDDTYITSSPDEYGYDDVSTGAGTGSGYQGGFSAADGRSDVIQLSAFGEYSASVYSTDQDLSAVDTISITAIAGNGTNGGLTPVNGLQAYFLDDFDIAGPFDVISSTQSSYATVQVSIPENMRKKGVQILLYSDTSDYVNGMNFSVRHFGNQTFNVPGLDFTTIRNLFAADDPGEENGEDFLSFFFRRYSRDNPDNMYSIGHYYWYNVQAQRLGLVDTERTGSEGGWWWAQWPSPPVNPNRTFGDSGNNYVGGPEDEDYIRIGEMIWDQFVGTKLYGISKISLKRRAKMNVFIELDDPDASAFVRDGDYDRLSPADKKKKLEEQLAASKEYLDKMFGEGMPGTATEIADYEPQKSFADIAQGLPYTDEDDAFDDPYYKGPPPDLDDDSDFNPDDFEYAANQGPSTPVKYDKDMNQLVPNPGGGRPKNVRPKGKSGMRLAANQGPSTPVKYDSDMKQYVPNPGGGRPKNIRLKGKAKMFAQHEPQGEVIKEKKTFKDLTKKIPGYYDGKPSPLGFPVEEPPKMKNGYHPDLVDGKKVANRFNRLDPISARAMPKTGNPHIDKKVRAAAKKPK